MDLFFQTQKNIKTLVDYFNNKGNTRVEFIKELNNDDVITAGTAANEAIEIINDTADAVLAGMIIGLDRKESGGEDRPAREFIEQAYSIPVLNIIDIDDILEFIRSSPEMTDYFKPIMKYREAFGIH